MKDLLGVEIHNAINDFYRDVGDWIVDVGGSFSAAIQAQLRRLLDPIVIDRDGDGIEMIARTASNIYFDMDGDGVQEWTGWVAPDDGFLAIDENNNGRIDGIGELIGDLGRSGFAELLTHDGNGDRILNETDAIWVNLKVWSDLNSNGVTDAGEMISVTAAGLRSIDLNFTTVNFTAEGNLIHEQSTFEWTNGTVGTIVDAWLDVSNTNSARSAAVTGNVTIAALPNIRGYGDVHSLHQAMLADGALTSLVSGVVGLGVAQLGNVRQTVEQILFRWAGTSAVTATSRGDFFDGRQLATLEKFLGTAFVVNGQTNPNAQSAPVLTQSWSSLVDGVMSRLLLEGGFATVLPNAAYVETADRLLSASSTAEVFAALAAATPATGALAQAQYWSAAIAIAREVAQDAGVDVNAQAYRTQLQETLEPFGLAFVADVLDDGLRAYTPPSGGIVDAAGAYLLDDTAQTAYFRGTGTIVFGQGGNDRLIADAGAYRIALNGGTGNDTLQGTSGEDLLDGGTGDDLMVGGAGNDRYVVDSVGDRVVESTHGGTDTVQSSITYILGAPLEHVELTGSIAVNGTGNALNNRITGNTGANVLRGLGGNDTLSGGGGTDSLYGGLGDDTYVDPLGDTIVDEGGTDTVEVATTALYLLRSGLEHLNLTSTTGVFLVGNGANNSIYGNIGNDTLDGKGGSNTLFGRLGDDTYILGAGANDNVVESANEGTDTVRTARNYSMQANIEILLMSGVENLTAYGNDLDNKMYGNAGDNYLDGGTGNDRLVGYAGDDIYIVDAADVVIEAAGGGYDRVETTLQSYTLAAEVEDLVLRYNNLNPATRTGIGNALANDIEGYNSTTSSDTLRGLAGNDTIKGWAGNDSLDGGDGNDSLDGGAGNDTMVGGLGDDVYELDNALDRVTEGLNAGLDRVRAYSMTYTLGANVEELELTGFGAFNGTGNSLSNRLIGNDYDNVLSGETGADIMDGRSGNDTYVVDNIADQIIENANFGSDTVRSSLAWTLGANLEHLILTGTSGIAGIGNDLANALTGNAAANALDGLAGNDTLDGGLGVDTLTGGLGQDIYIVTAGDVIVEAGNDFDTVRATFNYTLGSRLERLELIGAAGLNGTGNTLNNQIIGTSGANILDGGLGNDYLDGGLGNDTYIVDDVSDQIVERLNEGLDTVRSTVGHTLGSYVETLILLGADDIDGYGNTDANRLTGNDGDNLLDGRIGADTMTGGLGGDVYFVDNSGDSVVEAAAGGRDRVETNLLTYTLGLEVEDLYLYQSYRDAVARNGTGNTLDNLIFGTEGINVMSGLVGNDNLEAFGGNDTLTGGDGNDTLDGGSGIDSMTGGAGNDTYVLDVITDRVVEVAAGGTDRVIAGFSYILGAEVEELEIAGFGNFDGAGNALANTLIGNSYNNTLDGQAGADVMSGDDGSDTYVIDNAGDVVIEAIGAGIDLVRSSVTHTLGIAVENLTLLGTTALSGTGNELRNTIIGNAGANVLTGGLDYDTITGGAGGDTFVLTVNDGTYDQFTDFVVVDDTIRLTRSTFTGLGPAGVLSAAEFNAGTSALDADDRILFDAGSGYVRYDADGSGTASQSVLIAILSPSLALTNADFVIA